MDFFSRGSKARYLIGGAVIGAVVGLIVWLASRGWGKLEINLGVFRIGGEGWLAGWPMPSWIILVAGGALVGTAAGWVRFVREQRRTAAMSQCAQPLGLQYEPEALQSRLAGGNELFTNWSSGRHRFYGQYHGTDVDILDVTESVESSESNQAVRRTVVLLPAEGLPPFRLSPSTLAARIARAAGVAGITFDCSRLGDNDAAKVRAFQRRWHLAAYQNRGGESGDAAATDERAVCQLFSPRLMESLAALGRIEAQVRAGRLVVWRKRGFLKPADRARLLDDSVRLRELLVDAQARAATSRDEPLRAADPYSQAQRRTAVSFGAVAGFALGFFGGALTFSQLMESRGSDAGLGTFLLMPLLVLGGGAAVSFAGARVGRRLSRFVPLPRLPSGEPARPTAWRALGMFVGFAVGASVFPVFNLLSILLWRGIATPMWLDLPIALACIFVGVGFGWRVGCRIETAQARKKAIASVAAAPATAIPAAPIEPAAPSANAES